MNALWLRCGLVILALMSAPPVRTVAQQSAPLGDEQITAQVASRLFDKGLIGVHVDVRHRTVTLSGTVASLWLKDQAIQQARKVRDVIEVVSALTIPRGEGDEPLAQEIADEVSASSFFSIFDAISVRVADGVATLTGYVTTPDKSREFTKEASQVPGVQQVVNQIETLPVSMSDDDLRLAIADAIYGSPMFAQYTNPRAWPVHIIVRRGQVTLTGVVGSKVERQMAEMLAREAFGVMGVDNQLNFEE